MAFNLLEFIGSVFFQLIFMDSTVGFITIFNHHLAEYLWIFFQALNKQIQVNLAQCSLKVYYLHTALLLTMWVKISFVSSFHYIQYTPKV